MSSLFADLINIIDVESMIEPLPDDPGVFVVEKGRADVVQMAEKREDAPM